MNIQPINEGITGQVAAEIILANDLENANAVVALRKDTGALPNPLGNLISVDNPDNLAGKALDGDGNIVDFADSIVSAAFPVKGGALYSAGSPTGGAAVAAVRWEDDAGNKTGFAVIGAWPTILLAPAGSTYARFPIKLQGSPQYLDIYFTQFGRLKTDTTLADKDFIALINDTRLNAVLGNNGNLLQKNSAMNLHDVGLDATGEIVPFLTGVVSHQVYAPATNLADLFATDIETEMSMDGTGEIVPFADSIVSGRMPFKAGAEYQYIGYANTAIRFEDEVGAKVGFVLNGGETSYINTAPAGTEFVRVLLKQQGQPQIPIYFGPANEETYYILSDVPDTSNRAVRFENASGDKIGYILTAGVYPFTFSLPAGTAFLRVNEPGATIKNAARKFEKYPWEGKRVALYGDSITVDYQSATYAAMVKKLSKATTVGRYGQSGGAFAATLQSSIFLDPLIAFNADLVVVHSVNSHRGNYAPGTIASPPGEGSEIGGLKKIFNALITANKNVKIVFCTPLGYGDVKPLGFPDSFGSTAPNPLGLYVSDYIKGQIELCRCWGIPVVDLSSLCGFRDVVESSPERVYTLDGVHPNATGYGVMTNLQANCFNNMY